MGKEVFIDANIFLSLFLNEDNADACEKFLKSLSETNEIPVTTDFIMHGCLIITERNLKSVESLKRAFMFFANFQSLQILKIAFSDISDAIDLMDYQKMDFDDSLVIACMKAYGITKLASLDKHFDKVTEITRVDI